MKTSIMAFAALLGHTSAQNFLIINSCSTPVYFQPILSNGDTSGPLNTVQPAQSWSEVYRPHGSTVKIGTNKTLDEHLSIEYKLPSTDPDYIWYEFSTAFGNPFASHHNSLSASDGCPNFLCKANDTDNCYSTVYSGKIPTCPLPANLTAHLCE